MAYFGYEPSKVAVSVGQGVITSVELGTDAVNTIDILNDAVTPAKIDDDGTGFQMGTLGLGGAVSGAEKLTVTGTASFSGAITGNLTGNASGTSATVTGASQSAITSVGTLTSLTTSGVVLGADGSTSAPSFSFSSDTNTGVYRVSADTLGITASGNRQVRFFDGDTYFDSRIYAHVGSVGNPSYCFNDDTDTGIYKVASNQIGIATNGTRRIKIDASGETAIEGTLITSGSATFAGTLKTGGAITIEPSSGNSQLFFNSPNSDYYITNVDGSDTLNFYHGDTSTDVLILGATSATFAGTITAGGAPVMSKTVWSGWEGSHEQTASSWQSPTLNTHVTTVDTDYATISGTELTIVQAGYYLVQATIMQHSTSGVRHQRIEIDDVTQVHSYRGSVTGWDSGYVEYSGYMATGTTIAFFALVYGTDPYAWHSLDVSRHSKATLIYLGK
jgi:hypothetical protein